MKLTHMLGNGCVRLAMREQNFCPNGKSRRMLIRLRAEKIPESNRTGYSPKFPASFSS